MQISREFYIPKGSLKVAAKDCAAVCYVYGEPARPCAVAFLGKQSKPVWRLRFRNPAEREAHVKKFFANAAASEARRKADRQSQFDASGLKVGDILGTCWGYDQTNREFFEVLAIKGVTLTLRELAVDSVSRGWARDTVAPLPGQYKGEAFTRKAIRNGARIDDVRRATKITPKIVAGVEVHGTFETTSYA